MDFGMETSIFLAYTAGMLILYFIGRLFFVPIKIILKLLVNSIIGGAALVIIKLIGANFGIMLPVNPVNAIITGLTGVPGILGLLIYFNLF
ncbi:MAG: pro-sigmaK processing inhibitor BofA family protein [Anaerovoracaceae bacterium]